MACACSNHSLLFLLPFPHISEKSLTIRLALLLEPDLRLRFNTKEQYDEWAAGLSLLLALLLQPDDPLQRRSPGGSLRRCSTAGGSGRRCSSSTGREVVLHIAGSSAGAGNGQEGRPADRAAAAAETGAAVMGLPFAASIVRRALTINTGRVCTRSNSLIHLEAAAARSQAALAAVVATAAAPSGAAGGAMQRQASHDEGQKQQQGVGGLRRTATISLVASALPPPIPEPALQPSCKLTSSEAAIDVPCSAQQQVGQTSPQHTQPRRSTWQRIRQMLRAGSRAPGAGGSSRAANGSPSRQPLRSGGGLQPSSSSGDLLVAANQQGQAGEEQALAEGQEQRSLELQDQPAEGAARRHERIPTLQLWAEPQQQQQQQIVPPLDLGQLAGGGAGGGVGAADSVDSQGRGPPSLALAPDTGGSRGTAAEARPTPRLLLQGPFIHLQVGERGPAVVHAGQGGGFAGPAGLFSSSRVR